jgi:Ca2+-dependent lipid-binding protein
MRRRQKTSTPLHLNMTSSKEDWTPIDQGNQDADFEKGQLAGDGNITQQHILVEIVSALRVPSMDANSDSDPYVVVMIGNKKIHETKEIANNSNPIWTLETGSLFLIELEKDTVDLDVATVSFVVTDHNLSRRNTVLGSVEVKLKNMV